MKIKTKKYQIVLDDCQEYLSKIPSDNIHFCVTDPPYFIDGMENDWDVKQLTQKAEKGKVIQGLPVGMKFDPKQGIALQAFMEPVAKEIYRVLKPGGFVVCFSQGRLYHRMAMSFENAGFEIRDMFLWKYEGQAKAFSQNHFIDKRKDLSYEQKEQLKERLQNRKTPQLKPQGEPMVFAQKPKNGTFIDNWEQYEVGLVDTTISLDGKFPGTVMDVPKPDKKEKGDYNMHFTVKPIVLIEHLIKLFTLEGQYVLDPFMGSGSHGVAAININRKFVGIEKDEKYFNIATQRLAEVKINGK